MSSKICLFLSYVYYFKSSYSQTWNLLASEPNQTLYSLHVDERKCFGTGTCPGLVALASTGVSHEATPQEKASCSVLVSLGIREELQEALATSTVPPLYFYSFKTFTIFAILGC